MNRISEAELEIMKVLWQKKVPQTFAEIRAELEARKDWENSTVKTLLRRLCDKGMVVVTKDKVYTYQAGIAQKDYRQFSVKNLLERIFDGNAKALVAQLVEEETLSDADLAELSALFKVRDEHE